MRTETHFIDGTRYELRTPTVRDLVEYQDRVSRGNAAAWLLARHLVNPAITEEQAGDLDARAGMQLLNAIDAMYSVGSDSQAQHAPP